MEPNTFTLHFLCRQGFGFFLFYVVLNPEVRKLILAAWEWKSTLVTPFDEHEAIEIEEEEVYLKIKLKYTHTKVHLVIFIFDIGK